MTTYSLDYPLGRPVAPAITVRRRRMLPPGATPFIQISEQAHPDQVIAEQRGPNGVSQTRAGLAGRVVEVKPGHSVTIEGVATLIQGIVGVGGSVVGPLCFLPRGESLAVVPIPRGGVIVYPQRASLTLLQRAASGGAVGVIAGSASALELEAFARTDLSSIFDGLTPPQGRQSLTVMLTEGFGDQTMDAAMFQLFTQRANDVVMLTGLTQPRINVRPEVLLPLPIGTAPMPTPMESALSVGARVSVTGSPQRGARGTITYLFEYPQVSQANIWAQCALVRLDDGATQTIPLSALDRLG
ncbi:MAG TPA: hypothetical protein VKQ36_00065 [Ktedonobacterales bacterium]|nr:hypothetical protein [Ktedonobacterales bacterium]